MGSTRDALVELLKDNRIDISAKNNWGETPLLLAVMSGDTKTSLLFLENGTDTDLLNNWDHSVAISCGEK